MRNIGFKSFAREGRDVMIKENNDYQKYESVIEDSAKESPTRPPTYSPSGAPASGCVGCGLDLLSPGISKAEIENSPSYQLINGTAKKPGMQYADDPCTPKPNGTFQYPNLNQYIKDYLRTTPINENCIINLLFHPTLTYPPPLYLPEPIRVDLRECCNALTKSIWCAKRGDVEAIESAYDAFKKCVEKKINNAIDDFYRNHPDIYQAFPIQLHKQIKEIEKKIGEDKSYYIESVKRGYHYPYSIGNEGSCKCEGDVPTICCQPYEVDEYGNSKRDEQGNLIKLEDCWCPDGTLKNLCEECAETIELPLPHWITVYDKNNDNTCGQEIGNSKDLWVYYRVVLPSGEVFDSSDSFIETVGLEYYSDYIRRILPVKVPTYGSCKIIIILITPCVERVGCWCCKIKGNDEWNQHSYRIRKEFEFNFNYNDWSKMNEVEKSYFRSKFLDFDIYIDAEYGTKEFVEELNCERCD